MDIKKTMLFALTFTIALNLALTALAQTDLCSAISFADESFSVAENQGDDLFFRLKNDTHENFFIDFVSAEKNQFLLLEGKIVDKKITEFDSGRIGLNSQPLSFDRQETTKINVLVLGHFEDGQRCFVQKEFTGLLRPKKEIEMEPVVSFEQQIDQTGTGFIFVDVKNPSGKNIHINVQSGKAVLSNDFFSAEPFSETRKAIAVNNAENGEMIYFDVSGPGSKKMFLQVKFPQNISLTEKPEFEEREQWLIVSSYSSQAGFIDGAAEAFVVLKNKSEEQKTVTVGIKSLPSGVTSSFAQVELNPGESKQVDIIVTGQTTMKDFTGILSIEGDALANRQVIFENKTITKEPVGPTEQAGDEGTQGTLFTGLALLSTNQGAIIAGMALIATIVVIVFLAGGTKTKQPAWVKHF